MRDEKQLLLDEIKEKIEGSSGFIVASYQNFTSAKAREFRNLIAEANADFEIVPKRVFVKAAEKLGILLNADDFKGHIGVLFTQDDAAKISKLTVKYSESSENAIEIVGGHIDGQICSAEDVIAIAKLPGMNEMRSEFLGLLEAPMSQTLATLEAIMTSVPYCLEEKAKKSSD